MHFTSTSPWKVGATCKGQVEQFYANLDQPIPLFMVDGAFPFYSHKATKAIEKGFTADSIILSNHYSLMMDERYIFEVPGEYITELRKQPGWTEELRFIDSSSSETHIMLLKAAWFNDLQSFMKMRLCTNPADVKSLGKNVIKFNNEEWYKIVPHVALEVAWQKYTKVNKFNKYLVQLAHHYRHIIEYTKNDGCWGTGCDLWTGQTTTVSYTHLTLPTILLV